MAESILLKNVGVGGYHSLRGVDGFARVVSYSPSASGYESITVDDTVQTLDEDFYGDATAALITVETEPMRFRMDGMATTTVPDNVVDAMDPTRPSVLIVDGNTFTRAAAASDTEFTNATELAALVDALDDWHGAESAGAVVITSQGAKKEHIGFVIPAIIDIGETAAGDPTTAASYLVLEAVFTDMNNGDTLQFDGETFTMAATTSVADNEFEDQAGFAQCIDALDDWDGAVTGVTNVTITASEDGAEWNGYIVLLTFFHTTALVAPASDEGKLVDDGDTIILASADDIANFRAIRTTTEDAVLRVTYYE